MSRRAFPLAAVTMAFGLQLGVTTAAAAQNPQRRPPRLEPFAAEYWILLSPLVWHPLDTVGRQPVDSRRDSIVVPAGFVTDFASIPFRFRGAIERDSESKFPAVVHDYLYWEQSCTRDQADRLFRAALIEHGVGDPALTTYYQAVHRGGNGAWEANAQERRQGLPRVVPLRDTVRILQGTRWPELRRQLHREGLRSGPRAEIPPSMCNRGNETPKRRPWYQRWFGWLW